MHEVRRIALATGVVVARAIAVAMPSSAAPTRAKARSSEHPHAPSPVLWKANPEPDVAGYEIVWRESTDPLWTHTIPVGNVTTYTLKNLSKDNVQVGVRAVDRDGYRSPVAFPVPSS